MGFQRASSGLLLTMAGIVAAAWQAYAAEPVSFRGKVVTLIVGFGSGDGFDTYARLFARHLPKHLAGEPAVIVQNMPGAGSLTALNFVLNKGAKDGTTLGFVNPMSTVQPLFQPSIANFDPREFAWIGSMASDYYTCGFWSGKPVDISSLRGRKIVIGSTALSGGTYAGNMVMAAALGLDVQNVAGYRTMGELVLAAERGEVEGHCGVMALTLKSTFWNAYQAGRLRIAVAASLAPDRDLAEIPNAFDLVTDADKRQLLTLLAGPWFYGRPILAPSGLAPELVAALRGAFEATMQDADFLRDAGQIRVQISPVSGLRVAEMISRIYAIPKETINRAKPMFGVSEN